MKPRPHSTIPLLTLAASVLVAGNAFALRDAHNQGRWEKPCERGPDAEVPGFLINMGPTGARGVLTERTYIVKHIFAGSPADGVLKLEDEVTGANGREFSKHIFGPRHNGIDDAFRFLEYGTTKGGRIAYGGEFTLNRGPIDTEKWQQDTSHSFSHKSGLGYLSYLLSPERENAAERKNLHLTNIGAAYRDMADGHACAMMGFAWGLAGTFASDDAELKKKVFDHYKAWFNLARCHGSDSYVILPARDYADYSYYRDNVRNHTTATVALLYSYSTPKLRIHGK